MKNAIKKRRYLFPILVLVGVSLACSLGGNAPVVANQPPASNPPSNASPTLSGDPTSIVIHAIQILPTLSYRKREWFATGQGGALDTTQPPTLVAEFTPPSNSYVVMGEDKYLRLGSNFYSRKTGEAWSLDVPGALNQNAAIQLAEEITQAIQSGSLTIQAVGSEPVNGVPAQVFQVGGQVSAQGMTVSIQGKVWIDNDGRLLKMELEDPGTQQVLDISMYEYDPGIQLPAP